MIESHSSKSNMKTKVTSILLCALLSSTLGHEYLAAKRLASEARSKYNAPLGSYEDRAAVQQQCEWVCEGGNNTNSASELIIIVNETTKLVGIVNITAQVALIVDINANLVGLFNGTSGAVVIINIKTGDGVYIAAGQSTKVWISSKLSFEIYFKSLTSLQILINLNVGTKFNTKSASNAVLEIIAGLLVKLSYRIGIEIQGNIKIVISILINISTSITTVFSGPLKDLLKSLGTGLTVLSGDILGLIVVLEGLVEFIGKINGGLAALIKAGVEIDLVRILSASDGAEVLVHLLLAIVVKVDLSIVASLLNSVDSLLAIIVKLGGNVSTGATGVWKVVAAIVAVLNDKNENRNSELDVLLAALLEYSVQRSSNIDILISIRGLLEVIKIQESRHSSTNITVFTTVIQQIEKGQFVVKGISISAIIEILVGGNRGPIELVVAVLLRLTTIIQPTVLIPSLLFYLLRLLYTSVGIYLLQSAIPGLVIQITSNLNILAIIFRSINILTIVRLILTGFNITAVLTSVPLLGLIYQAVSRAVSSESKGSLSLNIVLTSSGSSSIVTQIKLWFKTAFETYRQNGSVTLTSGNYTITSGGSKNTSYEYSWAVTSGRQAHVKHQDHQEKHHGHHH